MSGARLSDDPAVRMLARVLLLEQKEPVVWAAQCCDLVGVNVRQAPPKCSRCGKPPARVQELRLSDVQDQSPSQ